MLMQLLEFCTGNSPVQQPLVRCLCGCHDAELLPTHSRLIEYYDVYITWFLIENGVAVDAWPIRTRFSCHAI